MKISNLCTIKQEAQQEVSAIAMVFVLLLLGLLLMNNLSSVSLLWQKQALYERRYYQHYNQAMSGLAWGTLQHWPSPTNSWYCLKQSSGLLNVCSKTSSHTGFILMAGYSDSLTVYALAVFQPLASDNNIIIKSGNWLDYCSEKKMSDCE